MIIVGAMTGLWQREFVARAIRGQAGIEPLKELRTATTYSMTNDRSKVLPDYRVRLEKRSSSST